MYGIVDKLIKVFPGAGKGNNDYIPEGELDKQKRCPVSGNQGGQYKSLMLWEKAEKDIQKRAYSGC